MPHQSLAHVALVVRDYDEAIAWFTDKLGFTLLADEYQPEQDKRWVLVAPPGAPAGAASLLLARAATPEQAAFIGNQAGGRVFLFLRSDDFSRDYDAMRAKGVRFVRDPKRASYGTVAVFEDLYGNLWDLVQFAGARGAGADSLERGPDAGRGSEIGHPRDFDALIPEMARWNNGAGIDPEAWIGCAGSYALAVGYSLIFWPRFERFGRYVLRGDIDELSVRRWEEACGGDRRGIEAVINHVHISDIHFGTEASEAQLRYLGRTLKAIYETKLARDFPDLAFTVDFNDEPGLDPEDYQLTFWQSEAP